MLSLAVDWFRVSSYRISPTMLIAFFFFWYEKEVWDLRNKEMVAGAGEGEKREEKGRAMEGSRIEAGQRRKAEKAIWRGTVARKLD